MINVYLFMFKNVKKISNLFNLTRFNIADKNKSFKTNNNQKIDVDKNMDVYIKKDKLLSDSNNKLKLKKNIDSTNCLVLHPVFNHKFTKINIVVEQ